MPAAPKRSQGTETIMSRPTKAMVLAAGLGKRMQPLTDTMPKPMVRLGRRPLIDHVLDRLAAAGITEAVVNVHYRAEVLEQHLVSRTGEPQIVISDERDALLDTGGGLVRALPLLGADPFVIHNSDSVWLEGPKANLDALFDAWDGERMDGLLLLASTARALGYDGYGDFTMDEMGRLARRREGMSAPFVFAGVSVVHPRLFTGSREEAFSLNRFWDQAIAAGTLYGLRLDGFWMHVGTPSALEEADNALRHGEPYSA